MKIIRPDNEKNEFLDTVFQKAYKFPAYDRIAWVAELVDARDLKSLGP